jgi:hypothetical protein
MSMNLRHAAALALVGWSLITPPVCRSNDCFKPLVDSDAPLWQWMRVGKRFDSIDDCELARQEVAKKAQRDEEDELERAAGQDANPQEKAVAKFEGARSMRCVSTEDPRLKKK